MPAAALGQRAVVADRDRQEVEHQVRVGDVVVGADEAARLEVVGRTRAGLAQDPLRPDARPPLHREVGRHGDGLRARVLHVDLEVVLQVLPHAGQVGDDADPVRAQLVRRADARQLEQLRRVDRAAAEHDLARPDAVRAAPAGVVDAGRARAVEADAQHLRERDHVEVGPAHHRVQVRARGGEPAPAVHVAVEGGEALLAVAVDVVGERVARLLHGGEERVVERAVRRSALEHERPLLAAEDVIVRRREAGLHPLEVRQAVRVVPLLHAGVARPALVVHRVAALEDHPVDGARAAEHLPARVVDPAVAHVRLGLGLVAPVVEAVADRERERRGHVDEEVPERVRAAGLQHEDGRRGVGGEAVGQHAAGRAAAHDHVVVAVAHGM